MRSFLDYLKKSAEERFFLSENLFIAHSLFLFLCTCLFPFFFATVVTPDILHTHYTLRSAWVRFWQSLPCKRKKLYVLCVRWRLSPICGEYSKRNCNQHCCALFRFIYLHSWLADFCECARSHTATIQWVSHSQILQSVVCSAARLDFKVENLENFSFPRTPEKWISLALSKFSCGVYPFKNL